MEHLQQLHGKPDYLLVQVGIYSCLLERLHDGLMAEHETDLNKLFDAIKAAVERPPLPFESSGADSSSSGGANSKKHHRTDATTVVIVTSSKAEVETNWCMYHWNRVVSNAAHVRGFVVFDREELEHRLLFKSEHSGGAAFAELPVGLAGTATAPVAAGASSKRASGWPTEAKNQEQHPRSNEQISRMLSSDFVVASPGPQVVATALLSMLACLQRNGSKASADRGEDAFGYHGTTYPWPPP
jgi:hypothetical protein